MGKIPGPWPVIRVSEVETDEAEKERAALEGLGQSASIIGHARDDVSKAVQDWSILA